jgi:acyl dehydratase
MTIVGNRTADAIAVGRSFGFRDHVVTSELIARYSEALDDHHPWYTGQSPFSGPVAPALIMHSEVYDYKGWYLPNVYGNLHARQEWELFRPVMAGDAVRTHSLIVDRYLKRNREYVVNEISVADLDGELFARSRTHQSFLTDDDATGIVVDKEREKAGGRRFDVATSEPLEALEPVTKRATHEMNWAFAGPEKNYHNDLEAAQKLGFPDIVVMGMMSTCFISEMMTRRFGAGWWQGGRMTLNLVNILWASEQITARGIVTEIKPEGPNRRAMLSVWTEKDDGTRTIVGTASALL